MDKLTPLPITPVRYELIAQTVEDVAKLVHEALNSFSSVLQRQIDTTLTAGVPLDVTIRLQSGAATITAILTGEQDSYPLFSVEMPAPRPANTLH